MSPKSCKSSSNRSFTAAKVVKISARSIVNYDFLRCAKLIVGLFTFSKRMTFFRRCFLRIVAKWLDHLLFRWRSFAQCGVACRINLDIGFYPLQPTAGEWCLAETL